MLLASPYMAPSSASLTSFLFYGATEQSCQNRYLYPDGVRARMYTVTSPTPHRYLLYVVQADKHAVPSPSALALVLSTTSSLLKQQTTATVHTRELTYGVTDLCSLPAHLLHIKFVKLNVTSLSRSLPRSHLRAVSLVPRSHVCSPNQCSVRFYCPSLHHRYRFKHLTHDSISHYVLTKLHRRFTPIRSYIHVLDAPLCATRFLHALSTVTSRSRPPTSSPDLHILRYYLRHEV